MSRAWLIMSLLLMPCLILGAETLPVGQAIILRGSVSILSVDGSVREISRGAEIYSGDTVISADDGFSNFRMLDSSIISLAMNSRLTIDAYQSGEAGSRPAVARLSLSHGRISLITGRIGAEEDESYQLVTPFGTLVLQGAIFECAQLSELYCSVFKGDAYFNNQGGSLHLGEQADFTNMEVTAAENSPVGLLYQSPMLQNLSTMPQSSNFNPGMHTSSGMPNTTGTTESQSNPTFPISDPITVRPVKKSEQE